MIAGGTTDQNQKGLATRDGAREEKMDGPTNTGRDVGRRWILQKDGTPL